MVDGGKERGLAWASARLGFGCSNLLGGKTRVEALGLLEVAYEAGIRHFDVARYYGMGDAEELVGEFAQRKRDRVAIATKFGLEPAPAVNTIKPVLGFARRAMRTSGFMRRLLRNRAGAFVKRGRFGSSAAMQSLTMSLRKLRTEYVDLLLLHECVAEDCTPELLEFLNRAKSEGKIRAFGVGTSVSNVRSIVTNCAEFARIAQFRSTALTPNVSGVSNLGGGGPQLMITHGALSEIDVLIQRLTEDPAFARSCETILGFAPVERNMLAGLLLRHAMLENESGIVLFRASSGSRIRSNVRLAAEGVVSDDHREAFARFVRGALAKERSR